MPNWGGASEKCKACNKTVYEMEKLTVESVPFHKTCFKCAKCGKVMRMGDFTAIQGEIFCKPHFTQLFHVKGNYEEGFRQALDEAKKSQQQQENKKLEKKEIRAEEPVAAAPAEPAPEPAEEPAEEAPAEEDE